MTYRIFMRETGFLSHDIVITQRPTIVYQLILTWDHLHDVSNSYLNTFKI